MGPWSLCPRDGWPTCMLCLLLLSRASLRCVYSAFIAAMPWSSLALRLRTRWAISLISTQHTQQTGVRLSSDLRLP